jgi:hypothetical protein
MKPFAMAIAAACCAFTGCSRSSYVTEGAGFGWPTVAGGQRLCVCYIVDGSIKRDGFIVALPSKTTQQLLTKGEVHSLDNGKMEHLMTIRQAANPQNGDSMTTLEIKSVISDGLVTIGEDTFSLSNGNVFIVEIADGHASATQQSSELFNGIKVSKLIEDFDGSS